MIQEGTPAPDFTLPDQSGAPHSLRQYRGRPVIVYFYPKDDTSGCTKEACQFRDLLPRFADVDAVVLGISPDDEASHAKFVAKYDLNFTLLADVPAEKKTPPTCAAFGVWQEKSMYGRQYMGVVRTTYLIDADGNVAQRWDKVKVNGHVEKVLEALATLVEA